MTLAFRKRTLLANDIFKDISTLFEVFSSASKHQVNAIWQEKIKLATTVVNDCIHCKRAHSNLALAAGMSREDLNAFLNGDIHRTVTPYEMPAVLYAQHYAELGGKPEDDCTQQLYAVYGEDLALEIINHIRLIDFGNRSGNTADSLISRFKGAANPDSNVIFELAFVALALPIVALLRFCRLLRSSA